jgi:hypothetical protein
MTPEILVAQSVRNQNRLSSKADLEILSSFPKLEEISCHTTRTPNLHYLESRRGRYGVGKTGLQNRKVGTRLILWKQSFLLSQGRSHARQGGARPKAPQRHKYNPLGAQGGWSIHPINREPPTRRRSTERKPTAAASLEFLRRCPRPCPNHHGWPYVVKPWWSSEAATWIRQVVVPPTFDGDINQFSSLLWYSTSCAYSYV